MAKQYGSQRKRGGASPLLVTLGILLVGLVGGALLLHATGAVELSFLKKPEPKKAIDRRGQVFVPAAGRDIPAYAEVSVADFVDPRTNMVAGHWWTKEAVEGDDELILSRSEIVRRVLRRAKPRGYIFTRSDFFPVGTRPGPTAGVPPGKRALRLKANEVPGLHGLKQGDRFDLVMTVSVEVEDEERRAVARKNGGLDVDGPYADLHESQQEQDTAKPRVRIKREQAEVKTIVNNGLLVQPVTPRTEYSKHSSPMRGTRVAEVPVEEIIIAIDPEEVADLNFAMAVNAKLQVAMRSGQVGESEKTDARIPDIQVVIDQEEGDCEEGGTCTTRVVEVIKGGERVLEAVPEQRVPTGARVSAPKSME